MLLGPEHAGRLVPLLAVREALLRRGTAYGTRDAALAELVRRARAGEPWKTGLAAVLLPGLRATVGPAARAYPRYRSELEAEALAGLLEALPRVRLERGRIAASLIWSARRSADRFLGRELRDVRMRARDHNEANDGDGPPVASGPRDTEEVLCEALQAHVLTREEAQVIAATRLGHMPARAYAAEVGSGLGSVRLQRYRAEQRLATWLANR